jgi:hypothetical protein
MSQNEKVMSQNSFAMSQNEKAMSQNSFARLKNRRNRLEMRGLAQNPSKLSFFDQRQGWGG